ncbi:MAG: aldo/keto reductase [candidate division Zixibacteria bacterium]
MGKSKVTRRGFLSTATTGLAAAGVFGISPGLAFAQKGSDGKTGTDEIIHRTLGKTGLSIPVVSMGVMNADNPEIVHAAYEAGIRHFDTAARYQYGRNEQMLGEVISRLGVRDKVIVGTKELRPAQRGEMSSKQVRAKLINLCEGSLSRLKTDYIDILYIHSVASVDDVNDDNIQDALTTLKKQGKIRFAAVSTHENMTDVINAVAEGGFYDVVLTGFNVTMADDDGMLNAIENAASKGVGLIAMKTQSGGQRLASSDASRKFDSSTIMKASLKWVLRNKSISTSIPGFDNFQHMREDFSVASDLEYTPEEEELLSDNNIKLGMGFCRQCRQCEPTCPNGVDIPTLMRTHMYAASYGNLVHARVTIDDIPKNKSIGVCGLCSSCGARCIRAIDIDRNIGELKSMYA